jgi:hypothetical protein
MPVKVLKCGGNVRTNLETGFRRKIRATSTNRPVIRILNWALYSEKEFDPLLS